MHTHTKHNKPLLEKIALKGFSPSSLTQYIRNPLDFYTQKILGLYESEEVEERTIVE